MDMGLPPKRDAVNESLLAKVRDGGTKRKPGNGIEFPDEKE
jgi:hypothetical protein